MKTHDKRVTVDTVPLTTKNRSLPEISIKLNLAFSRNKILYVTDGWLVAHADVLDLFDVVIVDEAHDSTKEKEHLLAIVRRRILQDRQEIRELMAKDYIRKIIQWYESWQNKDKDTEVKIQTRLARVNFTNRPVHVIVASATLAAPPKKFEQQHRQGTVAFTNSSTLTKIVNFFNAGVGRPLRFHIKVGDSRRSNTVKIIFAVDQRDPFHCPPLNPLRPIAVSIPLVNAGVSIQQIYKPIRSALSAIREGLLPKVDGFNIQTKRNGYIGVRPKHGERDCDLQPHPKVI
ncbi:hypothetical protein L596_011355 [Steinernema carpocapsae]|uniref:Uncharacterized protein n=1 Tax=Steinernema carpocapsae TaxID=34508 RepID=A0A4U5NU27_STECR|nr:hypothetical protein L596_011355 [Steinernema carpocapsae]